MKWRTKPTKKDLELLEERVSLKKEQNNYNMMDAFAKYSKLQRKINAIDEKLKESNDQKNTLLVKTLSTYGIQIFCGLCLFILTICYRRITLFRIDDKIDLSPFNYIISYPNEKNCISFHFWVMTCNIVARILK